MPENGDFVAETLSSFKRNGFVFPIRMFSQEEAIFYRKKYDEFVTKYGSGDGPERRVRGNKIFRVHVIAPWAAQIVRNSKLLAVVKAVLDTSNVLIWSSDLTVKSPNSSECFGWHQVGLNKISGVLTNYINTYQIQCRLKRMAPI